MIYSPLDKSKKNKKYTQCIYCDIEGLYYWHHVFGASRKNLSEKYGAIIYPCPLCHTGNTDSIHKQQSQQKNKALKKHYQLEIMEDQGWTVDEFRKVFDDNYLKGD